MKKLLLLIALIGALYGYQQWQQPAEPPQNAVESAAAQSNQRLQTAFKQKQNNLQIQGRGIVSKTLPDDNKGSRHQRFVLKLDSGQTLLVAHNIDLSPKIKGLKKGDAVEFYGEYEWSQQGGVIHWTHHDPQHRHIDGWLKHNGVLYQ
ncbi:DUF3465 domain-containing protein [Uruburuella testudinis]|uniref:DUF3465 domain-containing protein n=1 Tax=Uruburuella testudinis TaxID=1282863 RepID=A0ABY4DP46_9NEIS|nr:DUF3465 domain-containing protein [Uruburuella testudinis]UOO80825.1 DUF3465 domain-containing protein [Uruburuella testudinis]